MSGSTEAPAALVLKLWPNPFHHGALAIIRSLGRVGIPVYVSVESDGSPVGWSRYVAGRFLWTPDPDDVPALLDGLATIARSIGGRPVLIPTDDLGAIVTAEHADRLSQWFRLPEQPRDLPRRLASKAELSRICRDMGLPTPASRDLSSLRDAQGDVAPLGYPVVVKVATPWTAGSGLASTTVVGGPEELRTLTAEALAAGDPAVVVQEYLPDEQCDDWFFHGVVGDAPDGLAAMRLSFTGRKLRSYPPSAGLTSLGAATDNAALRAQAEAFLTRLGYRGIVDLDFRRDRRTGSYYLLDANPRPGAQFAIARTRDDVDAARALHAELSGRPVAPQTAQADGHLLCVENYDLVSAIRLVRGGQLTLRGWWRSLRAGRLEWAWFAVDDPAPWLLMWVRMAVRVVRGRAPVRHPHAHPRLRSRRRLSADNLAGRARTGPRAGRSEPPGDRVPAGEPGGSRHG